MLLLDLAVPRDIASDVGRTRGRLPLHRRRPRTRDRGQPPQPPRSRRRKPRPSSNCRSRATSKPWPPARAPNRSSACARTANAAKAEALAKAKQQLASGENPEAVLDFLAHTLTNRLLHAPTAALREAALTGDAELARAADKLFPRRRAARSSRTKAAKPASRAFRTSVRPLLRCRHPLRRVRVTVRIPHPASIEPMTPTLRRKLEALAERREELERLLADPGVIGDADRFRELSREFSQLEPVADRADRRSAGARAISPPPKRCAAIRSCANWPKRKSPAPAQRLERTRRRTARAPDSEGRARRRRPLPGSARRHRRRRSGDLRRRPVPHVRALRRAPGLEGRSRIRQSRRTRRLQGNHRARRRPRRVFAAEVRIRHPPRAARAGNRIAGPHPHLGRDRGDHPGRERRRADRDQSGRPEGRHLPLLRRRRPARQQDRIGDPHHPRAQRRWWSKARPNAASTPTATRR